MAAVSNPIRGRGHLGTQLARSHTEWPIKEMITSGLSLLQTHFPTLALLAPHDLSLGSRQIFTRAVPATGYDTYREEGTPLPGLYPSAYCRLARILYC